MLVALLTISVTNTPFVTLALSQIALQPTDMDLEKQQVIENT